MRESHNVQRQSEQSSQKVLAEASNEICECMTQQKMELLGPQAARVTGYITESHALFPVLHQS